MCIFVIFIASWWFFFQKWYVKVQTTSNYHSNNCSWQWLCVNKVFPNMLFMLFSCSCPPSCPMKICCSLSHITCHTSTYFSGFSNIPWASFISSQVTSNWCFLPLCSILLVILWHRFQIFEYIWTILSS